MSDYIIHNIGLTVSGELTFDELLEQDKPANEYPNYYVGKVIGGNMVYRYRFFFVI